ncbi:MAG: hypothetical protein JOY99_07445 [Sphingomonadaceae bacterium]|nr:hypothetical protein [Sphingomonadaceae bacterium]
MRPLLGLALLLLPAAVLARSDAPDAALGKALRGLSPAGAPISCVSERLVQDTQIIDTNTILFRTSGREVYLNHLRGGCAELTPDRAFASSTPVDQLCSGDIITVFEPTAHVGVGSCALGDFQAYRR